MGAIATQTRCLRSCCSTSICCYSSDYHHKPSSHPILFHFLSTKNPISDHHRFQINHQFLRLDSSPRLRNRPGVVRVLPLTEENVEKVLDEVRPGLMADGGNVVLHEIDGLVVVLKLQGACGSCPSSTMTLKNGIETRLRDKIPEIMDVEQLVDTETGLDLNEENVEKVYNPTRGKCNKVQAVPI